MEQPVVNCRKAFLSSDDIPHRTLTNRRKPGLRSRTERRHQRRVLFNNPEGEEPLGRSASSHQGALVALKSWGVRVPVSGVTQLWLSVVNDVIGCPRRGLVATQDHLDLLVAEGAHLLHWEDAIEPL